MGVSDQGKEHRLSFTNMSNYLNKQQHTLNMSPRSYTRISGCQSPSGVNKPNARSMVESQQEEAQNTDTDTELRKLADQKFKQMQEQEELQRKFTVQRQKLVQQEDPGDLEKSSFDQSASPSRMPKIECAFGDEDLLGLSEAELDMQCDDLFSDTPIKFIPRKDNQLDAAIME